MEEGLVGLGDPIGYKRIVLRLRWMTIVVTSYIILFYLLSNLIAYFLPPSYFLKIHFFYILLLFDTLMVSLGIYLTSQFNTDLIIGKPFQVSEILDAVNQYMSTH